MIARRGQRRRVGPAVGGRIVRLVSVAHAIAGATDGVQTAPEGDHREPAARQAQRRARRPGISRLVVLVHGPERGPAHATAAMAAGHVEPAAHDGRSGVVRRGRERCAGFPTGGRRIVDLDVGDGLSARTETADDEHPAIELRDRDLLSRGRHRGERRPRARTLDIDRRRRVGRCAETPGQDRCSDGERGERDSGPHERTSASRPASSSIVTPMRRASSALLPAASPTTT